MEEKQDNKKSVILVAIAIGTLIIAIIGAAYAYFVAKIGSGATANVTLTTQTTDSLTFSTGPDITIGPVTQANFAQNAPDQSGSTTGTVLLRASASASATLCYEAYINITSNDFEYTTAPTNTPELILTVSKNSTNVLSNYDITTSTGKISFPTTLNGSVIKHTVTATQGNSTTDNWSVTVTFLNLNSDQNNNTGKTFQATFNLESIAC